MSKNNFPSVVLVGRTNVGKSTLFNRISSQVKSIVFDLAGTTRDVIKDVISWQGRSFKLSDAGGLSFGKKSDVIAQATQDRALQAIQSADVILFVGDASVGIVEEDRQIAKLLYKQKAPVILVLNKIDVRGAQERVHEFMSLGFKHIVEISALHSRGTVDIFEGILQYLPVDTPELETDPRCKVVFLGKPNVGKSSLLNALLNEDRAIVSDIPGTTREPIAERIRFYQEDILLTDTAGVRKKRSIDEPLEQLMAKSTLHAVKDADIVVLMVDASEGKLSDQELKLAFYAFESNNKALLILFNKKDLVVEQGYEQQQLQRDLEEYKMLMDHVEQMNISCKTGYNVGKILPLIHTIHQRMIQQFSIQELTVLLKTALEHKPLFRNQQKLIVYRAQQIKSSPHIIALYVNKPEFFESSQCAFFEHQMRKAYDLKGVPIKFVIRKRHN